MVKRPNALLVLLAAFAAGIYLGYLCSWRVWGVFFTASFLMGILLRQPSYPYLLFLFFLLGGWRGSSLPPLLSYLKTESTSYPACIRGTVTLAPVRCGRWPLWRLQLAGNGKTADVLASFPPEVREGDVCSVNGTFSPVEYLKNPGDRARLRRNLIKRKVGVLKVDSRRQIQLKESGLSAKWLVRRSTRSSIRKLFPGTLQGLSLGLFLGDRREISRAVRNNFRKAGTAHLLAISGLHVGLAAYGVYLVSIRVLGRILLRGYPAGHGAALILSACATISYAVISGFSPSAERASLGGLLVTLAIITRRRPDPFSVLAAVCFTILFLDPAMLWSVSFHLSFSAVAGILCFGLPARLPPLARRLKHTTAASRLVHRFLFMPLRISASAFFGTLPVLCFHFGECHPWALLSNLAACPLLGTALGFGGAAIALCPLSAAAGKLLVLPSLTALRLLVFLNSIFSGLPGNTLRFPPVHPLYVIGALAFFFAPNKKAGLAGASCLILTACVFPARPPVREGGLVFNLEKGNAILYVTRGRSVLYVSNVKQWSFNWVLRGLNLRYVDVLISPEGGKPVSIRAGTVLSQPGTYRPWPGLTVKVAEGKEMKFSVSVLDGETRVEIGGVDWTNPPSLLISPGCSKLEEVLQPAPKNRPRYLIATARCDSLSSNANSARQVQVRSTREEGTLVFKRNGPKDWKITPYFPENGEEEKVGALKPDM